MAAIRLSLAAVLVGAASRARGALDVSFAASPPGPAPVGTAVSWTARAVAADPSNLWYRFRVRPLGGTFRVIRDYGPVSLLRWTSIDPGVYELEVSVRDRKSGEAGAAQASFEMLSRVTGGAPVVSATAHPLVFLYSSPPCEVGQARVRVRSGTDVVQFTPSKPCGLWRSLNFYLAGLNPQTSYAASLATDRMRQDEVAAETTFTTGPAPPTLPAPAVVRAAPAATPQGILLQAPLFLPPIATDLNGRLLWYGPSDLTFLTNPSADGTFFGLQASTTDPALDVVRQFDLVGLTVRETNAARVNEQLAALGRRTITGFHHEARSISGGRTVVLGAIERVLTDVQGPGPVDVLGDMIIVLDSDFQVMWAWDAFDHLDVSRRAVLGETCLLFIGCPSHYLNADANDWTHGNSVAETPDGALLYSARHQDWLIKVDYARGLGAGDVLWRLGKDGDFQFDSTDPYPWFSHQHDATFEIASNQTISLFDNGNTRVSQNPGQNSRGQAIELDETNRVAHLRLNADLGVFSSALGAAGRLDDGSYHFDAGFVAYPAGFLGAEAFSLEIGADGTLLSSLQVPLPVYRSFRLDDLYGNEDEVGIRTRIVDPRH